MAKWRMITYFTIPLSVVEGEEDLSWMDAVEVVQHILLCYLCYVIPLLRGIEEVGGFAVLLTKPLSYLSEHWA